MTFAQQGSGVKGTPAIPTHSPGSRSFLLWWRGGNGVYLMVPPTPSSLGSSFSLGRSEPLLWGRLQGQCQGLREPVPRRTLLAPSPTPPGGPQPGHGPDLQSNWMSVPCWVSGLPSRPRATKLLYCLPQGTSICHLRLRAHICAAPWHQCTVGAQQTTSAQ